MNPEVEQESFLRGYEAGWQAKTEAIAKHVKKRIPDQEQKIIEAVCRYYGISMTVIQLRLRKRTIVMPRQVCMYMLIRYTTVSLKDIGEMLGGYDHTTVIHSARTIQDQLDVHHEEIEDAVRVIRDQLKDQISLKRKLP